MAILPDLDPTQPGIYARILSTAKAVRARRAREDEAQRAALRNASKWSLKDSTAESDAMIDIAEARWHKSRGLSLED